MIEVTAITEWFRKQMMAEPSHFNQSMMLLCSKRMNSFALKSTLRTLCGYHEILRSVWNGKQLSIRKVDCLNLVSLHEFNLQNSKDVNADMLPLVEEMQSSINISEGPLVHAGLFHLPAYDTVFIAIHHLAVDGVSWRIIVEDIENIYSQLQTGAWKVRLPKISCSYAEYAKSVHEYASSKELFQEIPYWENVSKEVRIFTRENSSDKGRRMTIPFELNSGMTLNVLKDGISKHNVEVNDLLLTALSRAWKKITLQDKLTLSMEGHGREPFGENPLDLNRIVGWFTTIYPVVLDCSVVDIAEHVQKTAETMHSIPNKGFGYGTLLHIAHHENLDCRPIMAFNYLGSLEEGKQGHQVFSINNSLPQGCAVSSQNTVGNESISINCLTVKGCLKGWICFDENIIEKTKAQSLINEFTVQLALL